MQGMDETAVNGAQLVSLLRGRTTSLSISAASWGWFEHALPAEVVVRPVSFSEKIC